MKNPKILFPKLFLLFFIALILSSCIKNDGSIVGDAKVRIFNSVISDTSKNFYFNNRLFNDVTSVSALSSSTNSSYFVVIADMEYSIEPRNSISLKNSGALITSQFGLGRNYSIYYSRKDTLSATKPTMVIYEDTVRQNKNIAQIMFINMGSTLKSKVMITDAAGSFKRTLGYSEKSDYIPITDVAKSKTSIFLNLVDSVGVRDSISFTNFVKGRVYTVIIEGAKSGKLKERLVPNN